MPLEGVLGLQPGLRGFTKIILINQSPRPLLAAGSVVGGGELCGDQPYQPIHPQPRQGLRVRVLAGREMLNPAQLGYGTLQFQFWPCHCLPE